MRRITNLDWQVGADVVDVLGEHGNVLSALVGDAGDAVVIDDDIGRGSGTVGRRFGLGWAGIGLTGLRNHGVHDGAVGDASGLGEQIAALALEFFGGGFASRHDVAGDASRSDYADADRDDDPCRTEGEWNMNWNERQHRASAQKHSVWKALRRVEVLSE
jgi:hypothetical protein